ncbi:MAG: glycosyl transferase family 2 [Acidocella sp. 20-57-95]|nr:MAG: glycosyl transferase family 2 [Acidocella sp. 20-57-95]OYV61950.1 MAG: glycosyl transferase family 2 [Acidocella sp. 21-58-7]HQT63404.1 glycosyltransferase family 2 protein [Acidocella sp.]HQU04030.1 glycosyltransferase family 2 protein [Acidocella sp.]
MLNIIVPMAGAGSRFAKAGYVLPKPLIPVHGVPMIRLVTENVRPARPHRFIYICQRTHVQEFGLRETLKSWSANAEIVEIDGLTEGAVCTVLCAKSLFGDDNPMMIVNSDQFVDIDINDYLADMDDRRLDGLIMTMQADDPKWSFASIDDHGMVTSVVEKQVISNHATVGIYNFRSGRDFVQHAEAMIAKNLRINNEFYVAPVYNELIAAGANIGIYGIGAEADGMYGLGIPDDLNLFLGLDISHRATKGLTAA